MIVVHHLNNSRSQRILWLLEELGAPYEIKFYQRDATTNLAPPELKGLIAFYFNRMDQWFEEDEEIFVHPRDPYHRVDVIPTSRHIKISLDGEVLAETDHAMALFESNLPVRWYLPREDVSAEVVSTDTVTRCPYKGTASYYAVKRPDGETVKDLIWYYDEPLRAVDRIAGLLCFFNERVDVEIDGEVEGRPETAWKHGVKSEAAAVAARSGS